MNLANPLLKRQPQLLKLKVYPDPILCLKSKTVTEDIVDNIELQEFMDDLAFSLTEYRGVGLAAVQVGVPIRALVVRESDNVIKIINPVILDNDGEQWELEGCLSTPLLFSKIRRPKEVTVSYMNELGERKTTVFTDLLARAVSHEVGHLDGEMFFDKLSKVERSRILEKYRKLKRKFATL